MVRGIKTGFFVTNLSLVIHGGRKKLTNHSANSQAI